jgi:hypothetical protein
MPFPFAPTIGTIADPLTLRIDEIPVCRHLQDGHNDFLQTAAATDPIPTFRADLPITDDFFA